MGHSRIHLGRVRHQADLDSVYLYRISPDVGGLEDDCAHDQAGHCHIQHGRHGMLGYSGLDPGGRMGHLNGNLCFTQLCFGGSDTGSDSFRGGQVLLLENLDRRLARAVVITAKGHIVMPQQFVHAENSLSYEIATYSTAEVTKKIQKLQNGYKRNITPFSSLRQAVKLETNCVGKLKILPYLVETPETQGN